MLKGYFRQKVPIIDIWNGPEYASESNKDTTRSKIRCEL